LWPKSSDIEPDKRIMYPMSPQTDISRGMSFDLYSIETNIKPPKLHSAIPI
jgi:hypothetical protein